MGWFTPKTPPEVKEVLVGIPYVQTREKSQGFDGIWYETLQFLILRKPE